MNDERTRILRMLAEGTITVEECEELLRALSDRKSEKVEQEVREARENRPAWPFVLLVVLALLGVMSGLRGSGILRILRGGSIGPVFLLGTAFWIWMLVDCITRQPSDFKLLFTTKHDHDKWIWCGVLIFASWIAAIVYFVCVYRPTHRTARPVDPVTKTPINPDKDYTPSPPAKSITSFIWLGILLVVIVLAVPLLPALRTNSHSSTMPGLNTWVSIMLPVVVLAGWVTIFWIWMFIDCVARDYRDFGTLVPTDRSLDKVLWILLILFIPIIGALAYHISVRRRVRKLPGEITPSDGENIHPASEQKSPLPTLLFVGLIVFLIIFLPQLLMGMRITPSRHLFPFRGMSGLAPMILMAIVALPASLFLIFWALMLIDCITRDYREFGTLISSDKSLDKILWVLLILFIPLIGALAYYIAVRKRRNTRTRTDDVNKGNTGEYTTTVEH